MRRLMILAAGLALMPPSLKEKAWAAETPNARVAARAGESVPAPQNQNFWRGRRYCWNYNGWHGPGWYWCGYEWVGGVGWGGAYGWNGWAVKDYAPPLGWGFGPGWGYYRPGWGFGGYYQRGWYGGEPEGSGGHIDDPARRSKRWLGLGQPQWPPQLKLPPF
jgi:hypothetical protein